MSLSNKRIEENAKRSAGNRQAGRVCSCAPRWADQVGDFSRAVHAVPNQAGSRCEGSEGEMRQAS